MNKMNRLIKFQVRNMFKQKSFYVCLCLLILMGPILTFIGAFNTPNYETIKVMPQMVSLLSGEISLLSTIFIALFCCLDFNEGTTKNIIGRGYSRTQVLLSKYIVSLIGLFSVYIISFTVFFFLFGVNGLGFESAMIYSIINSIFRIIAYTIFFSTISFILEKNGSAIIACLFAPSIIQTLLSLIDSKLKIDISKYWITNVSNEFLSDSSLTNLNYSIIFYIIYVMIFVILGVYVAKKKEIK